MVISLIKNDFKGSFLANGKERSKAKLRNKNLLDESLRISKYTRIKVHVNPGLTSSGFEKLGSGHQFFIQIQLGSKSGQVNDEI